MKTKLLVERYGTWDVNRYSGKSLTKNTNPNAYGRDWADAALRKEDELYGDNKKTPYSRPALYALNVSFADKDLAKEEFKKINVRLIWDKEAENPVTKKKGTWVAIVDGKSNKNEFYSAKSSVFKWADDKKIISL